MVKIVKTILIGSNPIPSTRIISKYMLTSKLWVRIPLFPSGNKAELVQASVFNTEMKKAFITQMIFHF